MKKAGKKSTLIASGVMLVVCALLCLIPDAYTNPSSLIPREQVRIESVDNTQLYPLGIVYSGSQNCEVTVLTGEYAGETVYAHNYQNSALDKDKLFEAGDTAYAMVQMGANGLTVTLIDHYRAGIEGWIFAALALALIAVGGAVGHNPISILIPCHRVVGSDGSLTGYAGGVAKKQFLLELEGVDMTGLYVPTRGTAL